MRIGPCTKGIEYVNLETSPGLTIGSRRPVCMIEQLMRQNASERPIKEPRDSKRSDDLLANMMDCRYEKNG